MTSQWLILADDLTGAADCAITFAKRGLEAVVTWKDNRVAQSPCVLSVDADSRRLPAFAAAERHSALLARYYRPDLRLYKKIDSTLRGQPAAEMVATSAFLRQHSGLQPLAIVTPAFPATGRTTEGGCIRMGGQALEATELWVRDHTYPSADLVAVLTNTALPARLAPLTLVRQGVLVLRALFNELIASQAAAVVCDAVTWDDLAAIAAASLPLTAPVYWVGSAGLAAALADVMTKGLPSVHLVRDLPPRKGGNLVVVGSLAESSHRQASNLVQSGLVHHVKVEPSLLLDPGQRGVQDLMRGVAAELTAGKDLLLEIRATPDPNLACGAMIVQALAAAIRPVVDSIRALILTGGETACALLAQLGVDGIRLLEEVETGVPLGVTTGAVTLAVITKAGAFGGPDTLVNCLRRLKQ
jgi:uncharacterized protein YgbK (DUF1537 family)